MKLHEAIGLNKDHLDKIANGELSSPEIGRTGWTRRLILSSCSCHLIWGDTKIKFTPTAEDIIADDWNVYPKGNKVMTHAEIVNQSFIERKNGFWIIDDVKKMIIMAETNGKLIRDNEWKDSIERTRGKCYAQFHDVMNTIYGYLKPIS